MRHNIGPSTIIIDNGNQYFKKRNPNFHSAKYQVLMDGWKLPMSTCRYGCSCKGVAW